MSALREGVLEARIDDRSAVVGVIGLGFVGLPLSAALAEAGFRVEGVDVDAAKAACVQVGDSPIEDVPAARLAPLVADGRLRAGTDYDALGACDAIFVCVPTPFDRYKTPDLRAVHRAADGIAERLRPGQLVVLQSTTYPGTTEEAVLPRLEASGLRVGRDFHLAFSPERIDPGVPEHTVMNTAKVVGGVTPECGRLAARILGQLGSRVQVVSSARVAEMCKLLENVFRSVNIALVNELALLCERMEIDVWEVIDAAATKPFGFMPFRPGPGVGGHCIPVDPHYLAWKAREFDFHTRFVELAAEINQGMPRHVVGLTVRALGEAGTGMAGARVLVLGVAFKPDVDDARNSPAARVMALLAARGAELAYHDPHIPRFEVRGDPFHPEPISLESVPLDDAALRSADAVLVVTGHRGVDYARVCAEARLVVDATQATRGLPGRVVRLGEAWPDPARSDPAGAAGAAPARDESAEPRA